MSPEELHRLIGEWGAVWDVRGLSRDVRIRSSRRMYRSLGNYNPRRDEIRIAAHLWQPAHRGVLVEVLCHEAAHAAIRRLHPRGVRPHGPEWKSLMEAAGYPPRARLPLTPELAAVIRSRREHRRRGRMPLASPAAGRSTSRELAPAGREPGRDSRRSLPGWPPELDRLRRWLDRSWTDLQRSGRIGRHTGSQTDDDQLSLFD